MFSRIHSEWIHGNIKDNDCLIFVSSPCSLLEFFGGTPTVPLPFSFQSGFLAKMQ